MFGEKTYKTARPYVRKNRRKKCIKPTQEPIRLDISLCRGYSADMNRDSVIIADAYEAQDRGDIRGIIALVQRESGVLRGKLLMILAFEIALQTGDADKVQRILWAAGNLMADDYDALRRSKRMRVAIWLAVRDREAAAAIIEERQQE